MSGRSEREEEKIQKIDTQTKTDHIYVYYSFKAKILFQYHLLVQRRTINNICRIGKSIFIYNIKNEM